MHKNIVTILFVLILSSISMAEVPPQEVLNLANEEFKIWLEIPFNNNKLKYGFKEEDEIKDATLGVPFKIWNIKLQDLKNYNPEQAAISSIIRDSIKSRNSETIIPFNEEWYFPILFNNECRTLLVIHWQNNKWSVAELGMTELCSEIEKINSKYSDAIYYRFLPKYVYYFSIPSRASNNLTKIDFLNSTNTRTNYEQIYELNTSILGLKDFYKDLE